MGAIRQLDMNNGNKLLALQSIINHFNDLIDYVDGYMLLPNIEKVMPLELAEKRLKISSEIYANREVILYGKSNVQVDTKTAIEVLREPQPTETSRLSGKNSKKLNSQERLAMIMQVFGQHVRDKEKQRLRLIWIKIKKDMK